MENQEANPPAKRRATLHSRSNGIMQKSSLFSEIQDKMSDKSANQLMTFISLGKEYRKTLADMKSKVSEQKLEKKSDTSSLPSDGRLMHDTISSDHEHQKTIVNLIRTTRQKQDEILSKFKNANELQLRSSDDENGQPIQNLLDCVKKDTPEM